MFQCINSDGSTEVIRAFQHTFKYYERTGTLGKKLSINTINYKNGKKDYPNYPLYGWKIKMAYVVNKFLARSGIKVYHFLLTGNK